MKKALRGGKLKQYWDEACLIKHISVLLWDFTLDYKSAVIYSNGVYTLTVYTLTVYTLTVYTL